MLKKWHSTMKKLAFLIALILVAAIGTILYMMKEATKNSIALPQSELETLAERNL